LKRIALVLCAFVALGSGVAAVAQGKEAPRTAAGNAVGTAIPVDETALSLGDAGTQTPAAAKAAPSPTFAYFLRMLVVLALVLAAVYAVVRFMKKAARPKAAGNAAVKILASTGLGQGKALHVVALGTKAYLVGATDTSIGLVAEVEDKEFLDALVLEASLSPESGDKGKGGRDFGETLAALLGAGRRRGRGRDRPSGGSFLAGQRDRLRKL
jgi:flagellar protein FliO/FliZ